MLEPTGSRKFHGDPSVHSMKTRTIAKPQGAAGTSGVTEEYSAKQSALHSTEPIELTQSPNTSPST